MTARVYLLLLLLVAHVAVAVWDIWAQVAGRPEDTISRTFLDWGRAYPIFALALGILIGHIFGRNPPTAVDSRSQIVYTLRDPERIYERPAMDPKRLYSFRLSDSCRGDLDEIVTLLKYRDTVESSTWRQRDRTKAIEEAAAFYLSHLRKEKQAYDDRAIQRTAERSIASPFAPVYGDQAGPSVNDGGDGDGRRRRKSARRLLPVKAGKRRSKRHG